MPTALVIEDDRNTLDALARLVEKEGFEVRTAASLTDARKVIKASLPDLVLTDLTLPDGKGSEILNEMTDEPNVDVIVITGHASVETAVEALRLGAYDYLTKPVDVARLKTLLTNQKRSRRLLREVASLRNELREMGRFGPLVGTSSPMQEVYDLIEKVAPTDATVLIQGESGTGKELVATAIHEMSLRSDGPLVPVNCGAISPTLIESELFGHERGSFTGASRQHAGLFEQATGGTLFLDEITEMSVDLQVKLLRVLETGTITRVGGRTPTAVDVRIVTATNRNPLDAVEEGKLREDLYYRLKVFPIVIPPLRRRADDIEVLANHFLSLLNRGCEKEKQWSQEAIDRLRRHPWPGNVRELKHAVERAWIVADEIIEASHLPIDGINTSPRRDARSGPSIKIPIGTSIADAEKRLIVATLEETSGDKKKAAEILGVSLKTLYNRLNSYDEETPDP